MVQKDKQPEWFLEAKVRPDPSRRFFPRGPATGAITRVGREETLKPQTRV